MGWDFSLGYARGSIPQPSTPTGQLPCGALLPHFTGGTPQCLVAGVKQEESWGKAGDCVYGQQDLSPVVS